MSCGIGHRRGMGPALLWLWCGPAAAALIGPLAWEPPHATGMALEKAKRHKRKNTIVELYYLIVQLHSLIILIINSLMERKSVRCKKTSAFQE